MYMCCVAAFTTPSGYVRHLTPAFASLLWHEINEVLLRLDALIYWLKLCCHFICRCMQFAPRLLLLIYRFASRLFSHLNSCFTIVAATAA